MRLFVTIAADRLSRALRLRAHELAGKKEGRRRKPKRWPPREPSKGPRR